MDADLLLTKFKVETLCTLKGFAQSFHRCLRRPGLTHPPRWTAARFAADLLRPRWRARHPLGAPHAHSAANICCTGREWDRSLRIGNAHGQSRCRHQPAGAIIGPCILQPCLGHSEHPHRICQRHPERKLHSHPSRLRQVAFDSKPVSVKRRERQRRISRPDRLQPWIDRHHAGVYNRLPWIDVERGREPTGIFLPADFIAADGGWLSG